MTELYRVATEHLNLAMEAMVAQDDTLAVASIAQAADVVAFAAERGRARPSRPELPIAAE